MATAKKRSPKLRIALWLAIIMAGTVAIGWAFLGDDLRRTAAAGTAYGAHVTCSCRFIAGRSLEDCGKDKLAGMELVRFSDNEQAKSVTASIPLIASETATYREGYGCVLDKWER